MDQDIRWKQRFSNFNKALAQLTEFVEREKLNKFELQGLIQCFEYTYELGWNLLKDYLEAEGNQNITGSRSTIMEAFKSGLIQNGEGWMEMFKDRNKTSHTYNEETTNEIVNHIYSISYPLFIELKAKFDSLA
ncbi:MAG: nucleotidyltransferase substrate binding protein [Bacteroidales bacterium]